MYHIICMLPKYLSNNYYKCICTTYNMYNVVLQSHYNVPRFLAEVRCNLANNDVLGSNTPLF